jgi:type IV pilus assembly protein PilA
MTSDRQEGFTLIELLVVVMIVAVLAAIAIPAFLNQRPKADDAAAKEAVSTAQTAIETYRVDHGDFCGVRSSDLVAIESTLVDASNLTVAGCDQQGAKDSYTISVTSSSTLGTVYTVRELSGQAARSCSTPGQGGCSPAGGW